MSITRDMLKKSYTHVKELQGLQGVAVRKLGTKEAVEKAFQDLFDEYADRKYDSLKKEVRVMYKENTELKAKIHDLEAIILDKKAVIAEMTTENNKLRAEKDNLNDVIVQYREIVEELKKENKWLKEENDYLTQPWYRRIFSL